MNPKIQGKWPANQKLGRLPQIMAFGPRVRVC